MTSGSIVVTPALGTGSRRWFALGGGNRPPRHVAPRPADDDRRGWRRHGLRRGHWGAGWRGRRRGGAVVAIVLVGRPVAGVRTAHHVDLVLARAQQPRRRDRDDLSRLALIARRPASRRAVAVAV